MESAVDTSQGQGQEDRQQPPGISLSRSLTLSQFLLGIQAPLHDSSERLQNVELGSDEVRDRAGVFV